MLLDSKGREITVGALVKHVDPTGYHQLGARAVRVRAIHGRVAELDYSNSGTEEAGRKRVRWNAPTTHLGALLEVVDDSEAAA